MTRTKPPWHETVAFPALLRHARNTYGNAMRAALAEIGCDDMPSNGMWVVGRLANSEGGEPLPLSDLIRDLAMSKQAAGQLVDALVLRRYLERQIDPGDRRRLILTLTTRGRAAAAAQTKARERLDAALAEKVGEKCVRAARQALAVLIAIGKQENGEEADEWLPSTASKTATR
jgi:DNA-binding MarR family transcriptional regulator